MTRAAAPETRPVVLTVAGSDSGGGAGVQADLKTIEACGGFGTSAITSVTAQNTTGVESTHVLPVDEVDAQCEAVLSDFDVRAVKTGMLATAAVVELVTDRVAAADAPAVVDPVMVAASGDRLLAREAESAYEDLVGEATLVTPNADEAAVLTGVDPSTEREARAAGERLVAMGADAALVTGGHVYGATDDPPEDATDDGATDGADGDGPDDEGDVDGAGDVVDVLVTGDSVETFRHPRIETDATHGSGCTLSSAVATELARGRDLVDAVGAGVDLLSGAVRYNLDVGAGPGSVHHLVELRDAAAREPTAEAVASAVATLVDLDLDPLVPAVGTNVAGATPAAERPDEVAAVDGRIRRTLSGVAAPGGVRFGASTHVATAVLAAREVEPGIRFGVDYRYDDDVASALDESDVTVVESDVTVAAFDRRDAPDEPRDTATASIARGVERAAAAVADTRPRPTAEAAGAPTGETPLAVVDRGAPGAALCYLLARDPDALVDATRELLDDLAA